MKSIEAEARTSCRAESARMIFVFVRKTDCPKGDMAFNDTADFPKLVSGVSATSYGGKFAFIVKDYLKFDLSRAFADLPVS